MRLELDESVKRRFERNDGERRAAIALACRVFLSVMAYASCRKVLCTAAIKSKTLVHFIVFIAITIDCRLLKRFLVLMHGELTTPTPHPLAGGWGVGLRCAGSSSGRATPGVHPGNVSSNLAPRAS